jgi:hypothetical protein
MTVRWKRSVVDVAARTVTRESASEHREIPRTRQARVSGPSDPPPRPGPPLSIRADVIDFSGLGTSDCDGPAPESNGAKAAPS